MNIIWIINSKFCLLQTTNPVLIADETNLTANIGAKILIINPAILYFSP